MDLAAQSFRGSQALVACSPLHFFNFPPQGAEDSRCNVSKPEALLTFSLLDGHRQGPRAAPPPTVISPPLSCPLVVSYTRTKDEYLRTHYGWPTPVKR